MRSHRTPFLLALPLLLALTGCGYIHVGQAPAPAAQLVVRDESLAIENASLQREKTSLQQELALTRAQGEALRAALQNRAADGETSKRLVDQLNDATREITQLRSSYARLQAEGAQGRLGENAALQARISDTEEKLAASLRNYTELQDEVGRLRRDLARTRAENISLANQLRTVTGQYERAQAALAQLNPDLLAQKDARGRVEQDHTTLRIEPKPASASGSLLSNQRTGVASEARVLTTAASNDSANPETRTEPVKASSGQPIVASASPATAGPGSSASITMPPAAKPAPSNVNVTFVSKPGTTPAIVRHVASGESRFHIVANGDTLAKISARYYGSPSRWNDILAANRDILGETNNLVIGRTLRIP